MGECIGHERIEFIVAAKSSKNFIRKSKKIIKEMLEKNYYLDDMHFKNDNEIFLYFEPMENKQNREN